jgi:hypothetical protein
LAAAAALTLLLAGCVTSKAPLLTDGKPMIGERPRLVLYGLRDGAAHDPERVSFRWDGARYVKTGGMKGVVSMTLHSLAGRDLIVQSASRRGKADVVEYAVARKLADGAYLVVPVDENDAAAADRETFCIKSEGASCEPRTAEQLLALARATAGKIGDKGGLAVLLAEKR